jgi:hypothetical protein
MPKHFKQYDELDLPKVANEVLKQWEAEDTFGQSLELRKNAPPFVFYEGPPSANGLPGIHHVMARAIKDIFCRYQTQKGKLVDRKAGWDTHGLPIELGVEKELGITKEDIGKTISIEDYNAACKKAVMRYTDVWNDMTRRIGFWLDLEHPYVTYHTKYIESVWHLLKKLYDEDLLYKGYTIQPYSPAAGTGLSSHELNQPGTYKPVKDTSAVAMFKVKPRREFSEFLFKDFSFGGQGMRSFILAWTTTPWTLPSNCAFTVGPKLEYVRDQDLQPYTHEAADHGAGEGADQRVLQARRISRTPLHGKPRRTLTRRMERTSPGPWTRSSTATNWKASATSNSCLTRTPDRRCVQGDRRRFRDHRRRHRRGTHGAQLRCGRYARGAPAQHRHAHAGGPARPLQTGEWATSQANT